MRRPTSSCGTDSPRSRASQSFGDLLPEPRVVLKVTGDEFLHYLLFSLTCGKRAGSDLSSTSGVSEISMRSIVGGAQPNPKSP